jgi:hypothetical protein
LPNGLYRLVAQAGWQVLPKTIVSVTDDHLQILSNCGMPGASARSHFQLHLQRWSRLKDRLPVPAPSTQQTLSPELREAHDSAQRSAESCRRDEHDHRLRPSMNWRKKPATWLTPYAGMIAIGCLRGLAC